MVSHLIVRGHRVLSKLCSVIGLALPVSDVPFTEHINFFESIASGFRLEKVKSAKERIKFLTEKEHEVDSTDAIDLPASFDG